MTERALIYAVLAVSAVLWVIANILLSGLGQQREVEKRPRPGVLAPALALSFLVASLWCLWGAP